MAKATLLRKSKINLNPFLAMGKVKGKKIALRTSLKIDFPNQEGGNVCSYRAYMYCHIDNMSDIIVASYPEFLELQLGFG